MFRPQIQTTWVVSLVAIFSMMMVYFAMENVTYHKTVGFEDKIKATQIMEEALSILKKEVKKKYPEAILDEIDPNLTGLIFNLPQSPMITFSGDLLSKQTVLKPNFSALIVDLFKRAKLSKGDTVAVGMTGSMPGANIALLSACKATGIIPIIITSVGASQWGATDSSFTWLDMEKVLFEKNIISYSIINIIVIIIVILNLDVFINFSKYSNIELFFRLDKFYRTFYKIIYTNNFVSTN